MGCSIIRAATVLETTWDVGPATTWPEKAGECQTILVEGGMAPSEAKLATLAGRALVISRIKRELARLQG